MEEKKESLMNALMLLVCNELGIEDTEDFKNNRHRKYVEARMFFIYIARRYNFSYTLIGQFLNKDHSTIMNAKCRFEELASYDTIFVNQYIDIEKLVEKQLENPTEFIEKNSVKTYHTALDAIDPSDGQLKKFKGEQVQARSAEEAREICLKKGMEYLRIE